jgi:hypothetical protein
MNLSVYKYKQNAFNIGFIKLHVFSILLKIINNVFQSYLLFVVINRRMGRERKVILENFSRMVKVCAGVL